MPSDYGAAFLAGLTGFLKGMAQKKLLREQQKQAQLLADYERQQKEKKAELDLLLRLADIPQYQEGIARVLKERYGMDIGYTPPPQPTVAQQGLEMFQKLPASVQKQLLTGLDIIPPEAPPPDVQARAEYWREKAKTERISRQKQKQLTAQGSFYGSVDPNQAVQLPLEKRTKMLNDINRYLTEVSQYYDLADEEQVNSVPGLKQAIELQQLLLQSIQRDLQPYRPYIPFSVQDPNQQQRIIQQNRQKRPIQWVK